MVRQNAGHGRNSSTGEREWAVGRVVVRGELGAEVCVVEGRVRGRVGGISWAGRRAGGWLVRFVLIEEYGLEQRCVQHADHGEMYRAPGGHCLMPTV